MAIHIPAPTEIKACGTKEKIIQEFVGNVNSSTHEVSIARMVSPQGWEEPGQTPEFDEYTLVINGTLRIETKDKTFDVKAGEAIIVNKNEWIRYSSPYDEGAEYIAVCLPAFSPDSVNRDSE